MKKLNTSRAVDTKARYLVKSNQYREMRSDEDETLIVSNKVIDDTVPVEEQMAVGIIIKHKR